MSQRPKCVYPEGVAQLSPGSRVRERTLGQPSKETNYPEGVTHSGIVGVCNPFGVTDSIAHTTQGALADSRPWAVVFNAFGVRASGLAANSLEFGTTEFRPLGLGSSLLRTARVEQTELVFVLSPVTIPPYLETVARKPGCESRCPRRACLGGAKKRTHLIPFVFLLPCPPPTAAGREE